MKLAAYFFDLEGTLVTIANDSIACNAAGHVMLVPGVKDLHCMPFDK